MVCRLDLRVRLEDLPLLVDQIRNPLGVACLDVVAGSVRYAERAIRVAQERERKTELLGERRVVALRVEARA
jgi:hypothetical protein